MTESSRLDELLDAWEVARDEGRTVSPEELCADAPELLESLRMRVAALEMIDQQFKTPDTDATTDLPTQRNEPPPEHPDVVIDGDYGRLTFHARGGLGAVYRGVDRRLKRDVAIKFLGQQVAGDAEARDQFALEAEITSRLDHPGIVPIYGLGTADDGRPCYAMRFIEGETLDDAIARFHRREPAFAGRGGEPSGLAHATTPASSATPDSERFDGRNIAFRRLLGNFVAVCRTIAYAHNRGIAHRDIKPSNVMLGKFGETLVVDWGLARRVGREAPFKTDHFQSLVISKPSQATPTESGVGTPAYLSPEQITAPLEVRQATDIYSLGATLYKLLTGRVPVHAQSLSEQLRRVSAGELEPP
ncbi:MAG: serine/threonine-protein kinase, partial [Planctomycetota bacterium]